MQEPRFLGSPRMGEGMEARSIPSRVQKSGATEGQVRSDARGLEAIDDVLSRTFIS